MNESFNSNIFTETYKKIFDRDANQNLKMGFAAKIDVFVSKELKIQGGVGPLISLKKNNN